MVRLLTAGKVEQCILLTFYFRLDILKATGATVVSSRDALSRRDETIVHFIIVDSLSMPPYCTATPVRVATILRSILDSASNRGEPEPKIVDLSWLTQCIIRKKFIDIDSDERYQVSFGKDIEKGKKNTTRLFSIKVEHDKGNKTRYEVGDSIKFGREGMSVSYGRIIEIGHDKLSQRRFINVKVLVRQVQNRDLC